jgi:hypothetical protein
VLLTGRRDMFRASAGSATPNDVRSGAGQTAPLAQARMRASKDWALPVGRRAGRARPPGRIGPPRVDGQGPAPPVEFAAQWVSLRLFAGAVAP